MTLGWLWLVGLVVLALVCFVVLLRRQRLNKGKDAWSAGEERLPRLSETGDNAPHIGGGAGAGPS